MAGKVKHKFVIRNKAIQDRVIEAVRSLSFDHPHSVSIKPDDLRNLDQNAKMWAMFTDISNQVIWYGQKLTKEEWKDVLTAGLKKQRAVPGIDGGFVILGAHTSKMTKKDMGDLITLAYAFGNEQKVKWSEPEKTMRELLAEANRD